MNLGKAYGFFDSDCTVKQISQAIVQAKKDNIIPSDLEINVHESDSGWEDHPEAMNDSILKRGVQHIDCHYMLIGTRIVNDQDLKDNPYRDPQNRSVADSIYDLLQHFNQINIVNGKKGVLCRFADTYFSRG